MSQTESGNFFEKQKIKRSLLFASIGIVVLFIVGCLLEFEPLFAIARFIDNISLLLFSIFIIGTSLIAFRTYKKDFTLCFDKYFKFNLLFVSFITIGILFFAFIYNVYFKTYIYNNSYNFFKTQYQLIVDGMRFHREDINFNHFPHTLKSEEISAKINSEVLYNTNKLITRDKDLSALYWININKRFNDTDVMFDKYRDDIISNAYELSLDTYRHILILNAINILQSSSNKTVNDTIVYDLFNITIPYTAFYQGLPSSSVSDSNRYIISDTIITFDYDITNLESMVMLSKNNNTDIYSIISNIIINNNEYINFSKNYINSRDYVINASIKMTDRNNNYTNKAILPIVCLDSTDNITEDLLALDNNHLAALLIFNIFYKHDIDYNHYNYALSKIDKYKNNDYIIVKSTNFDRSGVLNKLRIHYDVFNSLDNAINNSDNLDKVFNLKVIGHVISNAIYIVILSIFIWMVINTWSQGDRLRNIADTIENTNTKVYNINKSLLSYCRIKEEYIDKYENLNLLLISTGLLGTFFGLVMAFYFADASFPKVSFTSEALYSSIRSMSIGGLVQTINNYSFAVFTSLAAYSLSWFANFQKYYTVPFIKDEADIPDKIQQEWYDSIKEAFTKLRDIFVLLKPDFESVKKNILAKLDDLVESINKDIENTSKEFSKSTARLLATYESEIDKMIRENIEALKKKVKETIENIEVDKISIKGEFEVEAIINNIFMKSENKISTLIEERLEKEIENITAINTTIDVRKKICERIDVIFDDMHNDIKDEVMKRLFNISTKGEEC